MGRCSARIVLSVLIASESAAKKIRCDPCIDWTTDSLYFQGIRVGAGGYPGRPGATDRMGDVKQGCNELVERDALRPVETNIALDLAHRPVAQHRRERLAHRAPAGRGGLAWRARARGG